MSRTSSIDSTLDSESWFPTAISYGWVMMIIAALAMVATLPGRTHGLGMITERLLADPAFGLTRATYGEINLCATLIGSLFCIGTGSLIDRFGIRICLCSVMLMLGFVVIAMSQITSLWQLFAAITLTRGFGQSALSIVSITIVGKWFTRNVSVPMSFYSVLMAIGFIAAALVGRRYAEADWRVFWLMLGCCVLGLTVLFAIVARNNPQAIEESEDLQQNAVALQFTHSQAVKTWMFWICSLSISLYGLIASGISLFNESILVDQGFNKETYYESLAWGSGIGVISKLILGGLGLKFSIQILLSISLILLGISLIWLTRLQSYNDVLIYVGLSAVSGGFLTVLFFSVWPQFYGTQHLGTIQGTAQMMTVLASASGPYLFALSKEWTNSYHPLIWMLAAVVLILSILSLITPNPRLPVNKSRSS